MASETDTELGVIETLVNMFGDQVTREVIDTIVESCEGDLLRSIDAIVNISSHDNIDPSIVTNNSQETNSQTEPAISYASASRSTGAIPKQIEMSVRRTPNKINIWTDQLNNILKYHNEGSRILILMRGAPGCGKSYLAKTIVEKLLGNDGINYSKYVYSTDDFFSQNLQYGYDKSLLSHAHQWNQDRASKAMKEGLSPIIIDNTNIELWEMDPYVRGGVGNGYIIEFLEPNTPWAKRADLLQRKNSHRVPFAKIKRMLGNFQPIESEYHFRQAFKIQYPAHLVPPVLRSNNIKQLKINVKPTSNDLNEAKATHESAPDKVVTEIFSAISVSPKVDDTTIVESNELDIEASKKYTYYEKQLQEFQKCEQEWENGESWTDHHEETVKPPRKNRSSAQATDKLMQSVLACQDWREIPLFMPSWQNDSSTGSPKDTPTKVPVETRSSCTCIEIGDTDINTSKGTFKIISTEPRDINEDYLSFNTYLEHIPDKYMLDKSTMTSEFNNVCLECPNAEKHFKTFRKLFKNVDKTYLRQIFDNCNGDINWAVGIALDGMDNQIIKLNDNPDSDDNLESEQEECNYCLANYNIIPDLATGLNTSEHNIAQTLPGQMSNTTQCPKKIKKASEANVTTLELKRQIEQNVVLPDNYYSQHCLKIRNRRRGIQNEAERDNGQAASSNIPNVIASPAKHNVRSSVSNISPRNSDCETSEDEISCSSTDGNEKTVNVNVGKEFISQLDRMFGREDMIYPENITTNINMPLSLLNEINALWMESIMNQLDENTKKSAAMLQQDEELARELSRKEEEFVQAGKEPKVPDFKEVMDMDFAMTIYQKDIAEWRNNEPQDLAARMTRDKLYNLFPDVSQETLSELLMAHNNDFKQTVEILLSSTNRGHIVGSENGVNKFIMEKEMERKEILMQIEKKENLDEDWTVVSKTDKLEMETVNAYREQATKHLEKRNLSHQKAQDYMRRDMPQIASYYSDVAAFHTKQYEQANSLAAVTLWQVHASKSQDSETLDLHFLRVPEAKETLDLFIDSQISKLQENNSGPKKRLLYIITGRGIHSVGGPRIKPAIMKRLRERGLWYRERNPGLLTAKVTVQHKLTHQI